MQVIGIMLVRNEDFFVEWAARNVLDFCDKLIIADHGSSDHTAEILAGLRAEHPEKISCHAIRHPGESHDLIKGYAGSDTWIFGVDGDEIYDAVRLQQFRQRLEKGEFRGTWAIFGSVLNVKSLHPRSATGHLAPPCRSMTKLYNFAAIEAWEGPCGERP